MEPQPPVKPVEKTAGLETRRQAAWVCLCSNLLLPGLGTFVAGRRVSGVLQLVVSQTGFALSALWAVLYVRDWLRLGSQPEDILPHLWIGLLGCLLFLFAWIWSLASSFGILRDSRTTGL